MADMTKVEWDALHNGYRVPSRDYDTESEEENGFFLYAVDTPHPAGGNGDDGTPNKAAYGVAELNAIDVTGYDGKWTLFELVTKIKKALLWGWRGNMKNNTPSSSLHYRAFPTPTLNFSPPTNNVVFEEDSSHVWKMKFLDFAVSQNYKLKFDTISTYQISNLKAKRADNTEANIIDNGSSGIVTGLVKDGKVTILNNTLDFHPFITDEFTLSNSFADIDTVVSISFDLIIKPNYHVISSDEDVVGTLPIYIEDDAVGVSSASVTIPIVASVTIDEYVAPRQITKYQVSAVPNPYTDAACEYTSTAIVLTETVYNSNIWQLSGSNFTGQLFADDDRMMPGLDKYVNGELTDSITPMLDAGTGYYMIGSAVVTCGDIKGAYDDASDELWNL